MAAFSLHLIPLIQPQSTTIAISPMKAYRWRQTAGLPDVLLSVRRHGSHWKSLNLIQDRQNICLGGRNYSGKWFQVSSRGGASLSSELIADWPWFSRCQRFSRCHPRIGMHSHGPTT